jgi:hypothetical protein
LCLWEEAKDCADGLISKFVRGEELGLVGMESLAGAREGSKATEGVPSIGGPSGVGLSRTAGATDTHRYKSEDEERMGRGKAGRWTSVTGRRTVC